MKTVAQTVIEADRFYTIAAKGGSVIQAVEKATNGGDIRLGKYEHKPEQEWAFVREGDGVYRIRNRASGKLIDLMMTGTANALFCQLLSDFSVLLQCVPVPLRPRTPVDGTYDIGPDKTRLFTFLISNIAA